MRIAALTLAALLFTATRAAAEERIDHGRFTDVALYQPAGDAREFVLFLSDAEGWNDDDEAMAEALASDGALVAGIDLPTFSAKQDRCDPPVGDFENLSHFVQGYAQVPTYYTPLLIGAGEGGAFADALQAHAPTGTFAAAVTLATCPRAATGEFRCDATSTTTNPPHSSDESNCPTASSGTTALKAERISIVVPKPIRGDSRVALWTPALLDAYRHIAATHAAMRPAVPPILEDLPIVPMPVEGTGSTFAIFLSGDGGWAGLDREVAMALAAHGVPIVGFDSLRYFWSARTPQGLADDLDRIARYYTEAWHRPNMVLIGFSQGADVLPFAINRLDDASRRHILHTVLLSLGTSASFEFHLGNWLHDDDEGLDLRPELARLSAATTLCIYGSDDDESICGQIPATEMQSLALPGDHHFAGAYQRLATEILARVSR